MLELPISAALNRRVPAVVERWYGRAPCPLHDAARSAPLARRARALAASVVQLGRRHDRARPADRRPRRADSQSPLSLERGDRRRQSVQPDRAASSTRSSTGSGRFLTFATRDLGAEPMTFAEYRQRFAAGRFTAASRSRHRLTRSMRVCHVSPHLPPDQAANALLPAELGAWAHARGDLVTFVTHAPGAGPRRHGPRAADESGAFPGVRPASGLRRLASPRHAAAGARSSPPRSTRRRAAPISCTSTATG